VASGIIQIILLLVLGVLSLLPFFERFSKDAPHRMAAVKQLEESMPPELLDESAAWYEMWKASGYDLEVYMPYFKQLDNKTGTGYRE